MVVFTLAFDLLLTHLDEEDPNSLLPLFFSPLTRSPFTNDGVTHAPLTFVPLIHTYGIGCTDLPS